MDEQKYYVFVDVDGLPVGKPTPYRDNIDLDAALENSLAGSSLRSGTKANLMELYHLVNDDFDSIDGS